MYSGVFTTLLVVTVVFCKIEEDVIPVELENCYTKYAADVTKNNEYVIQTNCLQSYLVSTFGNSSLHVHGLDHRAWQWIDSLGREAHRRLKRQTRQRRVRQEIRTLTEAQRQAFFAAVNALKYDTSVSPNKYDAFALMHQGQALPSAHGGPNFVSWHRWYLVLFENALREKNRFVTLPYWDSRNDHTMIEPTESIIFSSLFVGNGVGRVVNGPFANWTTPTVNRRFLQRGIGLNRSSLFNDTSLVNVFSKRYNWEILSPTAQANISNLERHHDSVHVWIGGHMSGTTTSPQDPIFWLHHCFVDYLWEMFRQNQRRMGINPETDYPTTTLPLHQPNRIMDNLLPPKQNIEGYSDEFTNNIYVYASPPSCPYCGGSDYLQCNTTVNRCQSAAKYDIMETMNEDTSIIFREDPLQLREHEKFVAHLFDPRSACGGGGGGGGGGNGGGGGGGGGGCFGGGGGGGGGGRGGGGGGGGGRWGGGGGGGGRKRRSTLHQNLPNNLAEIKESVQSPIMVDNRMLSTEKQGQINFDNRSLWAVTPITIVYERSTEVVTDQPETIKRKTDSENVNGKTFEPDHTTLMVETVGLSYNKTHTETITIDGKSVMSVSQFNIAFMKPILGDTKAYVRVFDTKGRLCYTQCLVTSTYPSVYHPCKGFIKISTEAPKMYYEMVKTKEDKDSISLIQNSFLTFTCNG